ncbi:PepSY domain-containing protein [Alkalicoccobacillus porphyridii]|uniref:PepSY domain-containing protein n=1 Tax=Alkalicoccobacillus porphyridii TaxID=2597270 RepID=A0A553ZZS3_9BACI|nr:PepSY domain-containing protein [Alkalicoccobacillus porphyridii]TSB46949.1 hypothetical protein FN960_07980 [Alkalicoccobacillus porphyridii]
MKKWMIISAISLVLIGIGLSVYAYSIIRAPLNERLASAEASVLASEELESITDISYYHGQSSFFVAKGFDADGDAAIAWLLEDGEEPVQVLKESEGISEEEAVAITESAVNTETIQSVKLGMENNTALYEIKYLTDSDHQGYYYLTFSDGSFIKRYSLRTD